MSLRFVKIPSSSGRSVYYYARRPRLVHGSLCLSSRITYGSQDTQSFGSYKSCHGESCGKAGTPKMRHDVNQSLGSYYNYTSGRWLSNESARLLERHLAFDVAKLCQVVAQAVNQVDTSIVSFTKIAEGGFFRVFKVDFRDGLKIIVRLPYPVSIPEYYGTASEVATIELLRLYNIPVPKVYAWDATKTNALKSEYVVMEYVEGRELGETWYSMDKKERSTAIKSIVKMEKRMFDIPFPACGSVYFKESLDVKTKRIEFPTTGHHGLERFCMGPSAEYLWWYRQRGELAVDRGPWNDAKAVLQAVALREIAWLEKYGQPRFPREVLYREICENQLVDPEVHLSSLSQYLRLTPELVPTMDSLRTPVIRHPDLSPSNIFISDSNEVTSLIDWQHCVILPTFLQARIPVHFQNYGDEDSESFRAPILAKDYDTMTSDDKMRAKEVFRRRQVHYFYLGHTSQHNSAHFNAIKWLHITNRTRLFETAGRPWEGDNISLQAEMIRALSIGSRFKWSDDMRTEMEPWISSIDIDKTLSMDIRQKEVDQGMENLRASVGVNIDGWVSNENYAASRKAADTILAETMAEATSEERKELEDHWPFQDHEELD